MNTIFQILRLRGSIVQSPGVRGGTITYRPELDGIRAIAISGVVLNHLGLLSQGGWGVNIFFVLSGYLITQILLKRPHKTRLFSNFYIRRFSRLAPIAFIYIVFSFFLAFMLKEPRPVSMLLAALLNYRNFFGFGGDPWSHYWSLGAEDNSILFGQ